MNNQKQELASKVRRLAEELATSVEEARQVGIETHIFILTEVQTGSKPISLKETECDITIKETNYY